MDKQQEVILVSALNKAGEAFIRQLMIHGLHFAAMANNKREKGRLEELGVRKIIMVDSTEENRWILPEYPIGKVFLFEKSLNLSCRYIRLCRKWTSKPIYLITRSGNSRLIYKALGASYVIHTNSDDVSFLIQSLVG
ncbi:hypothetical protein FE783_34035 [Paenibacillus mesophilus]|uniref:hypothetical protein n=1 Tax=Paenibacillus mesophilus TaxID=2582849 RepID=UPI00110E1175|nr:hypothetical protein [Paenibacillus mesophilus]TMV43924.1 hypothetical protein FE783_34035 [Paenibacillus mesophilus]